MNSEADLPSFTKMNSGYCVVLNEMFKAKALLEDNIGHNLDGAGVVISL